MTTRRDALKERGREYRERKKSERKKNWNQQEQDRLAAGKRPRKSPSFPLPRLTRPEKASIDQRLRPYTIMDYLFRLRIKTNYVDSNMFTDGPEDQVQSDVVRGYLCRLASGTLLLHELAVSKIIGHTKFNEWITTWINGNIPPEMRVGLAERSSLIDDNTQ